MLLLLLLSDWLTKPKRCSLCRRHVVVVVKCGVVGSSIIIIFVVVITFIGAVLLLRWHIRCHIVVHYLNQDSGITHGFGCWLDMMMWWVMWWRCAWCQRGGMNICFERNYLRTWYVFVQVEVLVYSYLVVTHWLARQMLFLSYLLALFIHPSTNKNKTSPVVICATLSYGINICPRKKRNKAIMKNWCT